MADYPGIERLRRSPDYETLRSELLAPHRGLIGEMRRVYIYGAARMGARAKRACDAAGIEVLGFVDSDPARHGTQHLGVQVQSPGRIEVADDSAVLVASNVFPHEMLATLDGLGCTRRLFYPVLSIHDPERFPAERELQGTLQDLAEHSHRYGALFDRLADEESRRILDQLLQFRLTLDPAFTLRAHSAGCRHYFDRGILELGEEEVFVDGGGYDGDTTQDFVEETGGRYRSVHFFEPDGELLDRARAALDGAHDVHFYQKALFSEERQLRFNPGEMDGSIGEQGTVVIDGVALDEVLEEAATFIKLDVEGAEAEVLRGAKRQILANRPKLALSVYHFAGDLWRLPELVSQWQQDYRLYLRHYSPSVIDTVMYCL